VSAPIESLISAHVAAATAGLHRRIAELHAALADLGAAHNDLRDRHERMFRPGVVTDYDATKQLYRQQIGVNEKGEPIKSPWRPHSQHAGALKLHVPLAQGQPMLLISPDGDIEQGIGIPLGWSSANPSPSTDKDTVAGSFGGFSWSLNGGKLTITGGVTLTGDFKASGGVFTHGGKNVGSDHTHSGVQTGAGNTGAPV
jgi:phage baseplate assembly protein gpV